MLATVSQNQTSAACTPHIINLPRAPRSTENTISPTVSVSRNIESFNRNGAKSVSVPVRQIVSEYFQLVGEALRLLLT